VIAVAVASQVGWPNPLGLGEVVNPGSGGGMSLIILSVLSAPTPAGTSSKLSAWRVFQAMI
jgi:hypothetical protein